MRSSVENYLRTIYHLYEKQKEGIRSKDIATHMNVSKPSVSGMIKKLISMGYLRAAPYSRVHFTAKGLKEARRVMHNHRVIEVFLSKVLKHDLSKVHEEAHKLEHAFSDESIKRLDGYLKNPKLSPYGRVIPHEK